MAKFVVTELKSVVSILMTDVGDITLPFETGDSDVGDIVMLVTS